MAHHRNLQPARSLIGLAALTAAGLALRLVHLTRFELFVDEAATWWFAQMTASGRLAEQMSLEPTPPLYYALVGLLIKLFGDSDFVLRLPSVVFGAAGIPTVYVLGRVLFSGRVGWIAACLLTIHPLHVFYSREARVYPLLLCLTMWTLWALWRALDRDTTRAWVIFGALLVATCYSHFYGLFLAATAGVAIVFWGRDNKTRGRGVIAVALALLGFAPYVAMTFPHLQQSGAAWSIESFYRDYPEERRLGKVLETQLIGADYHPYLRQLDRPSTPPWLRVSSLLAQLVLLLAALAAALRSGRLRAFGFLAVGWLVPILIPWGVTLLGRAIFHAGRHDVYALGGLCVMLAVGLDLLLFVPAVGFRRGLRVAVTVGVVAALVWGAFFRLLALHLVPPQDRHRSTGAWIAEHATAGDRVFAMGIRRLITQHYTQIAGSDVVFESFPSSTDRHPGWSDVLELMKDQEALHAEARRRVEELGKQNAAATIFLLLRPYEHTDDAVSSTWLVDRHLLENLWAAGWIRMSELESPNLQIGAYRRPETQPVEGPGAAPESGGEPSP